MHVFPQIKKLLHLFLWSLSNIKSPLPKLTSFDIGIPAVMEIQRLQTGKNKLELELLACSLTFEPYNMNAKLLSLNLLTKNVAWPH
jgi:hypothetical protein